MKGKEPGAIGIASEQGQQMAKEGAIVGEFKVGRGL